MKINGHTYGEFISMDNVRIELHMSKRRLAYLLQNGYIPCEIRNSATWRYKIRTKDVVAYIKSGISPDITPDVFKRKPQAEVERISTSRLYPMDKAPAANANAISSTRPKLFR